MSVPHRKATLGRTARGAEKGGAEGGEKSGKARLLMEFVLRLCGSPETCLEFLELGELIEHTSQGDRHAASLSKYTSFPIAPSESLRNK